MMNVVKETLLHLVWLDLAMAAVMTGSNCISSLCSPLMHLDMIKPCSLSVCVLSDACLEDYLITEPVNCSNMGCGTRTSCSIINATVHYSFALESTHTGELEVFNGCSHSNWNSVSFTFPGKIQFNWPNCTWAFCLGFMVSFCCRQIKPPLCLLSQRMWGGYCSRLQCSQTTVWM